MSAVLLDTNVISELVRPRPDAAVVRFVAGLPGPLLSVLTLHELTFGAERVAEAGRRARLIAWVSAIRARFDGRTVEVTADIAELAGRLRGAAATQGRSVDVVDALIGASALSCGATLATRNVRDFAPLGVELVDPWAAT